MFASLARSIVDPWRWRSTRSIIGRINSRTVGAPPGQRIVIFVSDWRVERSFWFNEQYLPDLTELDRDLVPTPEGLLASLGGGEIIDVPVPHDCLDGFLTAYWRRPAAFLEDRVRAGISYFSMLPATSVSDAIDRLGRDLESGRWLQRNGWLLDLDELDTGQRLVVARL